MAVELSRVWAEQCQGRKKDITATRKNLAGLRETHQRLSQQVSGLCESFALGEISKAEYLAAKAAAQQRDDAAARISELEAELENMGMENNRTWIYCRVAHPDAHALAAQQASLEAYAEAHGFEVVGATAEQASGLDFSRRGLAEVSNAVDDGDIDLLLVANLSRLGRDVGKTDAYLRWLEDQFVEVVCADGTVWQTASEILHEMVKASGISLDRVQ